MVGASDAAPTGVQKSDTISAANLDTPDVKQNIDLQQRLETLARGMQILQRDIQVQLDEQTSTSSPLGPHKDGAANEKVVKGNKIGSKKIKKTTSAKKDWVLRLTMSSKPRGTSEEAVQGRS